MGLFATLPMKGQDTMAPLKISGSVDVYYKYDLRSGSDGLEESNINTSFAGDHNSVSIGMANLIVSQTLEKVGFVADLSFGPRGQDRSILNAKDGNSFHIQNLYLTYSPSKGLTFTAGFMGTFIGYEVISPVDNFHYSTSYLFTNGPFQNAGIKASLVISDKITIMAGLFNDWNVYHDANGLADFGTRLSLNPVVGFDVDFHLLTGPTSGTTVDVVSRYAWTSMWSTGVNFTVQRKAEMVPDYAGLALYQEVILSDALELGVRTEWFKYTNQNNGTGSFMNSGYFAATLTGNINLGPLTLIPEWRYDFSERPEFSDRHGDPVSSASQILLAAVYAF